MSEAANVVWYGITLAVFVLIALYGAIVYGNMREANAYRKLTAEATHGLATTAKAVMRDPPGWVPKPPTDPSVEIGRAHV